MSCNYYINTTDVDMVFDLMPRVSIIPHKRCFEIHICQTAGQWKPLFEIHSFSSFMELEKVLRSEKYKFIIVDEYGDEISPQSFINYMIEDNLRGKSRTNQDQKLIIDETGFEWVDYDFS